MRGEATPAFLFVPGLPDAGQRGTIEGEERHYLVNVCRAAVGDMATATDGLGQRGSIRIAAIGSNATFEVESIERIPRGDPAEIACGAPEGARGDWLIEKLAEFGIERFQPIDTHLAAWRWSDSRCRRLERLTIAALKQSRSVWRTQIEAPLPLADWLAGLGGAGSRWLADAAGDPVLPILQSGPFTAISGPAPGLDIGERDRLVSAGFRPVRLGAGVLRAETAGLALAAHWSARVRSADN